MKNVLFTLILSALPFAAASAATLNLKAQCTVSGEYSEVDNDEAKSNGWTVSEDEYGDVSYVIDIATETSQLPINKSLGDLNVSVTKDGRLELGMSVGDADAGADSSLLLPQKNGELLPIAGLQWTVSGGDYASGMWGFNCSTEISINN